MTRRPREHHRSCRTCGWAGVYDSAARADNAKKRHSCARRLAAAERKARGDARRAAVDRTPKQCTHKQASHVHGTRTCYVLDRCRCQPCSTANTAAETWRERQKAYGRYDRYVDADQARSHVASLMTVGMGLKRIVAVSGVPQGALWKLMYGKRRPDGSRQPTRRLTRQTHEALMAVDLDLAPGAKVPALGTHRRIQALVALGWSQSKIAAALGVDRSNFAMMMARTAVLRRTHDATVALYDAWSMRLPPTDNPYDRAAATRARRHAAARGWAPPLAWDDDDLDDPTASPQPHGPDADRSIDEAAVIRAVGGEASISLTRAEKAEVYRRLVARGLSNKQAMRQLRLSGSTVASFRREGLTA